MHVMTPGAHRRELKCVFFGVLLVSIRLLGGTLDGVMWKDTILLRLPPCNLDFSGIPLG